MCQSGNKYKKIENWVMNSFMDISIVKRRLVEFRKKHGHSVLHQFFAKPVACNETPKKKNEEFQEKKKRKIFKITKTHVI